jgi:penicillin amidase
MGSRLPSRAGHRPAQCVRRRRPHDRRVPPIQVDSAALLARDLVPLLADASPETEDGATIGARIGAWDGACEIDSMGCAAWNAWQYRVMRDIFDDDLGSLARDYAGSPFSWVVLGRLLDDPFASWWDDAGTPDTVEHGPDIVARAMDEAGAELRAAIGSPDRWSWGRLHTATFREATLGQSGIGPLEWYFNDGPHAVPGTSGAIDNTYFRFSRAYPDPDDPTYRPVGIAHVFDVTNLPSYRLTIDMGDLDGARIVITTGRPATRSTGTTTIRSTCGGAVGRSRCRSRPRRSSALRSPR